MENIMQKMKEEEKSNKPCWMDGVSHFLDVNYSGFTLIELLIVITVIGMLASALAFSYQGWMMGYNVESQIKEMHLDLMNARARAIQRHRMHFVDLTAAQYTIYEDTNPAPNGDGISDPPTDTQLSQIDLDPRYPVTWSNPGDTRIEFDIKGLSSDNKTICSNTATTSNADYDCIAILSTRIKMGKLANPIANGGVCIAANCIEK
jgi:prepilin-type N-terminal cleavage/methylation domain-containing protein